ncbi:hypothetical protein ACLOJK_009566, partial [Asimina triloba]
PTSGAPPPPKNYRPTHLRRGFNRLIGAIHYRGQARSKRQRPTPSTADGNLSTAGSTPFIFSGQIWCHSTPCRPPFSKQRARAIGGSKDFNPSAAVSRAPVDDTASIISPIRATLPKFGVRWPSPAAQDELTHTGQVHSGSILHG